MTATDIAAILTKVLKLLINIIIVIIYKHGNDGYFLGANYNKNRDAETLASGVYVGYLIYNLVVLVSTCVNAKSISQSLTDTLMNGVGFVLWIITAGVVIQFWVRFIPKNHFEIDENPAAKGIAMGSLTLVNAALYLAETILTFLNYRNSMSEKY